MTSLQSFEELKAKVEALGYLRATPVYYDMVTLRAFLLLTLTAGLVFLVQYYTEAFAPLVFIAALAGFSRGQFLFIGHEIGHGQVTTRIFPVSFIRRFVDSVGVASFQGWFVNHRKHHNYPNDPDKDPDTNLRVFALSEEQARARRGIKRIIGRYQACLFPLFCIFVPMSMRISSTKSLGKRDKNLMKREIVWMGGSASAMIVGMTLILGFWNGLLFLLISEAVMGLYMEMAFIVNHAGMKFGPRKDGDTYLNLQVESTRNVLGKSRFADWVVTFLLGGLNYQIEHHLFTDMSRRHFRHVAPLVKRFCEERGITYHTVPLWRAYREVFAHLWRIGKYCRSSSQICA